VVAHHHEVHVLGVVGVRVVAAPGAGRGVGGTDAVGDLGAVLAQDDLRAAAIEAVVQERRPLGPGVRGPEQRGADLVVAVHGGGDEVVPGGPVDVDDDAAVAERLADQASDAIEGGLELTRGADPARSGERVAQTREGRMGRSRHLVYSSAAGRLVLTLTCACSTAPGSG